MKQELVQHLYYEEENNLLRWYYNHPQLGRVMVQVKDFRPQSDQWICCVHEVFGQYVWFDFKTRF